MNESNEGTPATTANGAGARGTFTFAALARACVLTAIAASTALFLQYLNPASAAFCGLESGCEVVRHARFSYFFGVPFLNVPLVGLFAYGAVYVTFLAVPGTALPLVLTAAGALGALVLLSVQAFVLQAFCWLCVSVDVAGIFAAAFAWLDFRGRQTGPAADPLRRWAWIALAGVAVSAPAVWTQVKPAPKIPDVILREYVPGKVNVIEFADFECPYCRRFHPVLQGALRDYPADRIRFVRKNVPLPSHEDALPAARADVCAEQQGLGEKLADRLVSIELSASADRRAALEVGVDAARFDQCMASDVPDRRIDADSRLLEAAGMAGLPTTYIQGKRLLGTVSDEAVRDALDRAIRGEEDRGIPAPVFVPLSLLALAAVAWLGRDRRGTVLHERPI
ncbi:MAG TPA: thioredoxin domain-containing protein [Polyangiaceae bacterium]|nr:thioredoxin domain-containing protein [Polyangiaceae bacterium]